MTYVHVVLLENAQVQERGIVKIYFRSASPGRILKYKSYMAGEVFDDIDFFRFLLDRFLLTCFGRRRSVWTRTSVRADCAQFCCGVARLN